ncbi:MAG TPA: leucyl/phenylalanyl-tRNA--protein transferase [Alphaproteobacteria bacterium]
MRPLQITADTLLRAYQWGLFPMGENRDDPTIYWVDPEQRGVLPLDRFHLPRSLRRSVRRKSFALRVDSAFDEVIRACAQPYPGRYTTWINTTIERLYLDLFEMGYAHSVECWRDGALAGGLYGVAIGGAFFGESMFSRESDASKVALAHLVVRLRIGGYDLLDTQFVTEHLARFGAVEVPRARYLRMLARALKIKGDFYRLDSPKSSDSSGASGAASSADWTALALSPPAED